MDSLDPTCRKTWMDCRRLFEQRLVHAPLSAIPLRVIDWAAARGLDDRSYAWLSHDCLVISNGGWQSDRADRLVVIPKPDWVAC